MPLFALHDAVELVCMPELHLAASAVAVLEEDLAAEEDPVSFPAGLEAEMPTLGKHLNGNRHKD